MLICFYLQLKNHEAYGPNVVPIWWMVNVLCGSHMENHGDEFFPSGKIPNNHHHLVHDGFGN